MVAKTINISGLMTIVCLLLPQRPRQTLQKLETLTCSNISGCTDAPVLFYIAADTLLSANLWHFFPFQDQRHNVGSLQTEATSAKCHWHFSFSYFGKPTAEHLSADFTIINTFLSFLVKFEHGNLHIGFIRFQLELA